MGNSKNYREFLKYLISDQCANDLKEQQTQEQEIDNSHRQLPN